MSVKRCTISTERFIIDVISFGLTKQIIDVKLKDNTYILSNLQIIEGEFFCYNINFGIMLNKDGNISLLKMKQNSKRNSYHTEEFYYYIKTITDETLNWIEYWQELEKYNVANIK